MEEKQCQDCVFYAAPNLGLIGACGYPVPGWIRIHSGGGFVSGYEAQSCSTFKSRMDVFEDEIKHMPNAELTGAAPTTHGEHNER